MARTPAEFPPLRNVVLEDWRSRWHGRVQKVCAGPSLERSVASGEIGVFTPTGEEREVQVEHETREGVKLKAEQALVYRRTATRIFTPLRPFL